MSLEGRIYGLETEYAINFYGTGQRAAPDPMLLVKILQECLVERCGIDGNDFLITGGKFHHDVGHAEWASPECRTAYELATYDKAADHLLRQIVKQAELKLGDRLFDGQLLIVKNNVDSNGHTYGTHENYLTLCDTELLTGNQFLQYLIYSLTPFLVSRQILAGSGHITGASEQRSPRFELSQRAPFIDTAVSGNTTHSRPIINLGREGEALASGNYRRLHLILGDANLSGWATWMKMATTGIVLRMIEDIFIKNAPELKNPVEALKTFTRDATCRVTVPLRGGKEMSALNIQWRYFELADAYLDTYGYTDEEYEALDAWEKALVDLEADPMLLRDRADWAIKKSLLDAHLQKQKLTLERLNSTNKEVITQLQSLDLLYHDISANGIFSKIWKDDTLITLEEIRQAQHEPPRHTRARVRGQLGILREQYLVPINIDGWQQATINNQRIDLSDPLEFDDLRLFALEEKPLEILEKAAERSPDAALYYRLGTSYTQALLLKKAIQSFNHAIQLNPEQLVLHTALAYALLLQGSYEEAIRCSQKANQLATNRGALQFAAMGEAYRYLGRYEEAVKAYTLQLKITPDDCATWEGLGQVYLKIGQIDKAEEQFLRVFRQDPERHITNLALGIIHLSRSEITAGQAFLQRVLVPLTRKQTSEMTARSLECLQALAHIGMEEEQGLLSLQTALKQREPVAAQGIFLLVPLLELLHKAPQPTRDSKKALDLVQASEPLSILASEDEGQDKTALLKTEQWWQDALGHPDEHVRTRAIKYARWREGDRAITFLKEVLGSDESEQVHCAAIETLATIGGEEAGAVLFSCLSDPGYSATVRWAAEDGLEGIRQSKLKAAHFDDVPVMDATNSGFVSIALRFCPSCGDTNPVGEAFCSNCGSMLPAQSSGTGQNNQEDQSSQLVHVRRRRSRPVRTSRRQTASQQSGWGQQAQQPQQDPWAQQQQSQQASWGQPAQQSGWGQQVGWGQQAQQPQQDPWAQQQQGQQGSWGQQTGWGQTIPPPPPDPWSQQGGWGAQQAQSSNASDTIVAPPISPQSSENENDFSSL